MNTDEQALSPGRRVEGTGNIRRIAHITDLHMRNILPGTSAVCVRRSRDMATLFPQALEKIHLQHYVVTPALNAGYPHTYEEGEELARRTNACGHVRLSLSGHYHRGTPLLDHGNTTFTTAPAFCESPFQWRVYELNDDGRVTMETHQIGVPKKRPVVFLDRDGVINEQPSYREGPERLTLVPGSAKAIRSFNEAGRAVVVITNQSAIGYGYVSEAVVASVNDKLCRLLAEQGAYLDAIYYDSAAGAQAVLPQYLDDSRAKPSPHMLLQAAAELNLDHENSWMVGDNSGDIAAGKAIGAKTILVQSGNGKNAAAAVKQRWPDTPCLPDLNSATTKILE